MGLLKSAFSLRAESLVGSQLALRHERFTARVLNRIIGPIFISFGFVDCFASGHTNFLIYFLTLRTLAAFGSSAIHRITRGRARYGTRFFLQFAPYMYVMQALMLHYDLLSGPYFSGLALVLLSATILFPLAMHISLVALTLSMLPVFLYLIFQIYQGQTSSILALGMGIGTLLLAVANSTLLRSELVAKFVARNKLAEDLRHRNREIEKKAKEILKRKRLEVQFSPQVLKQVLANDIFDSAMQRKIITTVVIDIKDSTQKSQTLSPAAYKEVVEEIFDVFAAACLKWNLTIDKFTGDGAQAFAGYPENSHNDFNRTLNAALDTLHFVTTKVDHLNLRWQAPLLVRIGVAEGPALVGFLGGGSLKSFTAIGETVSFTHRLCGAAEDNSIYCFSFQNKIQIDDIGPVDAITSEVEVTGLKGFSERSFKAIKLVPNHQSQSIVSSSRCASCGTFMVFADGPTGLPSLACPACSGTSADRKKAA